MTIIIITYYDIGKQDTRVVACSAVDGSVGLIYAVDVTTAAKMLTVQYDFDEACSCLLPMLVGHDHVAVIELYLDASSSLAVEQCLVRMMLGYVDGLEDVDRHCDEDDHADYDDDDHSFVDAVIDGLIADIDDLFHCSMIVIDTQRVKE
jgi:hypothetical protein